MESLFEMLPTFAGMGKIGLVAFAVCALGYGIWKLAASWNAYNKQVKEAEKETAENTSNAQASLNDTDSEADEWGES